MEEEKQDVSILCVLGAIKDLETSKEKTHAEEPYGKEAFPFFPSISSHLFISFSHVDLKTWRRRKSLMAQLDFPRAI